MRSTPQNASSTPSPPPITASSTLSVSSWRTSTPRPAPSAARIASSRARTVARAISRLATFATTISSTQSTAPSSTISGVRADRTSTSCSGRASGVKFELVSG